MSGMRERTQSILEASVREFIKTGKPITSEILYEIYDFGIKPAMIRLELGDLSHEGFLYQIHPSGGRYPTDKAYRHFVDSVIEKKAKTEPKWIDEDKIDEDLKGFMDDISHHLGVLSVGFDVHKNTVVDSGLCELLERIPISAKEELLSIVSDFEAIEERLQKQKEWIINEVVCPKVFIGESPITKSKELSVVAGRINNSENDVIIFSIGPKRMDYERAIGIMKLLSDD
ncbi:MAG: heat-inducible transcriptional repressor [Parcubacteria group bacterium LiPW_41]|nr:MAG: heat-inducible transcriptional repressor [Parcubacteria group bacterium LiPW_41]